MRSEHLSSTNNTQEHTQLRKALRESELLREISELLASSLDLTHTLQILVKRTTEACDVQRCAVWLLNQDSKRFLPAAYHSSTGSMPSKALQIADRMWHNSTLLFHDSMVQRLLQENGLVVLEDLHSIESMQKLAEKFFVHSVLLVALVREKRPVGVMALDNPGKTFTFTPDQQQLARAIGQQAAIAIDNARLYEQAQTERERAEKLIKRVQSINHLAMAVNSGQDLEKVLLIATKHLIEGLQAQGAAISILEENVLAATNTIFSSSLTIPHTSTSHFSLTDLSHCHEGANSGNLLFVPQDHLKGRERQWFQHLGMQHILIVPLMIGNQTTHEQDLKISTQSLANELQNCIGFAFVNYKHLSDSPGVGRSAFARDIAAQCAHAIEKARILNAMRNAASLATERANTLDTVLNAMTEGIIVFDMQGQVMLHNNTFADFARLTPNIRTHLSSYLKSYPAYTFYGHTIQAEDHPLTRALRGEHIQGERFLSRKDDGSEDAFEVNIAPLFDSHGQQIGIVSAFRDITEHVRAEQRIRRALDTMLHAAEAVSGLTDIREMLYRVLAMTLAAMNCQRGVVQLYNQESQKFTPLLSIGFSFGETEQWLEEHRYWLEPEGYQYSDIYAQLLAGHATLVDTQQYSDHFQENTSTIILAAPLTHNTCLLGVLLLDRSKASTRKLHSQHGTPSSPLPPSDFSPWDMAVVEGIAQFAGLAIEQTHWQKEAEIARTNEASMRASNALKDEFLAITAHEFRTPLTVVLAHSQMMGRLLKKSPQVAPELKIRFDESLFFIEEQAHQLTNIVNTFLEVTRLNRGQITLNLETLNLKDIAQEAIANYSATLTKHTICYRPGTDSPPYILKGDKVRLLQIFGNLLQNAIKYSPLGGPITVSISRVTANENGYQCNIEVCIEDKGIGVPKDAQPFLFERFYRAHNISGSQARGVGLGLYVVAEFLHLHNGTIRVESNGIAGEGSCFIFTLPVAESKIEPEPTKT
jgi:signal transduction histidine kinase/PAS domain-containing protein